MIEIWRVANLTPKRYSDEAGAEKPNEPASSRRGATRSGARSSMQSDSARICRASGTCTDRTKATIVSMIGDTAHEAGKPSLRHCSIPPLSTDTSDAPASSNRRAATDERRSVLQTNTMARSSRTRSGIRSGNSFNGRFVAPAMCPRGPVNSSGPLTSMIRSAAFRSRRLASAVASIQ